MAEKVQKLVEAIEGLTLTEVNDLVKLLEEKFGVSASFAPTMMPGVASAGQEKEEGPSKVNVVLTETGATKIQVIKVLREINPELGLKEAKDIVDTPPQVIKEGIKKEEADKIKEKLEAAGAKVEYK
ncbi:MAG: 50S ribosomal protein L7/L12 [Patescibacteria group bacterium]|nr:50S ribosomal protein L7/L12 [Patescibacteria group bacterium]MCL5257709.1 50S ribosomal protein L7/L12 [Patescibacteria group bacterium]